MARTYTGRFETYALHKAYHGLHGYAAGLTAIGKATQPCYSGMFPGVHHVSASNIPELENHITFGTGGNLAAMIVEPLQGYGGIFPLDNNYLQDAFDIIKEAGGVTIADEVQTGYGRTGEAFWGFQQAHHGNVMPDMITIAKGMGSGVGIIGAVVTRRSIAEAFCTKMFFNTYGSNPVACAVARAVLKVYDEEGLVANCDARGKTINRLVGELCENYPTIFKEVRGCGLFQGLEVAGATQPES